MCCFLLWCSVTQNYNHSFELLWVLPYVCMMHVLTNFCFSLFNPCFASLIYRGPVNEAMMGRWKTDPFPSLYLSTWLAWASSQHGTLGHLNFLHDSWLALQWGFHRCGLKLHSFLWPSIGSHLASPLWYSIGKKKWVAGPAHDLRERTMHVRAKLLHSCPSFCDPSDCSLPGSFLNGIIQARILEWVAMSSSRGSSWPRDQTCVSCTDRWILYHWNTGGNYISLQIPGCIAYSRRQDHLWRLATTSKHTFN